MNRNQCYGNHSERRYFGDSVGLAYKKGSGHDASPQEVLKYVEERVVKAYPENFKNSRKVAPSSVEGTRGPRRSPDTFELSIDEQVVMKKLVKQGVLTEEQYIKDLKELAKQGNR